MLRVGMSASPTGQTKPTPEVPAFASDVGTQDHTLWSNDAVKQLALPEPREPLTPETHAAVLRTLSREDVRRLPTKLGVPLPATFSGSSGLDDSLSQADSAANSLLSGTSGSCQGGGQGVGIGASNVAGPAQYLPRFAAVPSAALLDMVHVLHSARRFDEMLAAAVVAIRRRVCATRRGVAAAGQVHNVVELAGKSCCSRRHLSHGLTYCRASSRNAAGSNTSMHSAESGRFVSCRGTDQARCAGEVGHANDSCGHVCTRVRGCGGRSGSGVRGWNGYNVCGSRHCRLCG